MILGYMKVDAGDSLSVSILQSKLEDLIKNGPVSLPSVVKYSKALTIAAQLEMEHGEAAVQLDLDPTPCDEAALVQDFIDTAPKPKPPSKRKRKQCPTSATALFNKGLRVCGFSGLWLTLYPTLHLSLI